MMAAPSPRPSVTLAAFYPVSEDEGSAGATLAVGTDTDSVAVRAARQNGSLNSFSGKWITLQCGAYLNGPDPVQSNPQGFSLPSEYDLVVANILQVRACTTEVAKVSCPPAIL